LCPVRIPRRLLVDANGHDPVGHWHGCAELASQSDAEQCDSSTQAQHRIRTVLYSVWYCMVYRECRYGIPLRSIAHHVDSIFCDLPTGRTRYTSFGKSQEKCKEIRISKTLPPTNLNPAKRVEGVNQDETACV